MMYSAHESADFTIPDQPLALLRYPVFWAAACLSPTGPSALQPCKSEGDETATCVSSTHGRARPSPQ